jgi:hypothetical protein
MAQLKEFLEGVRSRLSDLRWLDQRRDRVNDNEGELRFGPQAIQSSEHNISYTGVGGYNAHEHVAVLTPLGFMRFAESSH